jgi:isochorismate synthase
MLLYRFPGQAIVSKNGYFKKIQDVVFQGFIISDFNNKSRFIFAESEESFINTQEQYPPFCISKEAYLVQAAQIVSLLQESSMEKLVYSRVKSASISISGSELFHRLEAAYPKAFVYYFKDPMLGEWIGATPEVLIKGTNQSLESMSLAGTKKAEDESPWGAKEIEEQDFVSLFLRETLVKQGVSDLRSDGPKTVIAGPLAHLRTDFQWKSSIDQAWNIVKDLHPTPAVSGTPRETALVWIQSEEKHERQFYAGIIGSMDEQSMNLYVNLRCAQIQGDQIYLYVGGGFTADSIPEKEWEETENKSHTLLNLL